MDSDELIRLVGAFFASSVLTTLLTGWQNRRKMSADAVNILQTAAGTAVERSERDNARLREENAQAHLEKRQAERHNELLIDAVHALSAYSKRQSEEIRRLGGRLEDPPDLPDELLHH